MTLLERQLELEQEGVQRGIEEYRSKVQKQGVTELMPGTELLKAGMVPMVAALDAFLAPTDKGRNTGRMHSSKKLFKALGVSNEELAYLTLRYCLTFSGHEGQLLQNACIKLTDTVLDQHEYSKFKRANPGYLRMLEEKQSSNRKHRRTVVMLKKRQWGIEDTIMSEADKMLVGLQLIEMCVKTTGFVMKRPVRRLRDGKSETIYHLSMPEKTMAWLEKHHAQCELLTPLALPMIMKPRPWSSATSGGYYLTAVTQRHRVVKTRNSKAVVAIVKGDMSQVFSALNTIQETPWKINTPILDVLEEVWVSGGNLGGLPSAHLRELPAKPWSSAAEFQSIKQLSPDTVKAWKRKALDTYDLRISEGGQRRALTSKLRLAGKFRNEPQIFFPHTLDWRGRVYPVPSWINPQADDVGKALIKFAEGKALGVNGAYWLAIHGANTYGNDKISFDDRVLWVNAHRSEIIDSAENPLDGQRFWADADSPYCFLAFCMEWAERLKTGSPQDFISHLPIALDGTCNGLQHFSGMLLDAEGGKYVNLLPSEAPQDIYSKVAQVVSGLVQEDVDTPVAELAARLPVLKERKPQKGKKAAKGRTPRERAEVISEMAHLWHGKVDREVAKGPTMTKPYGAKKHGYKFQLMAELKKRGGNYLGTTDAFQPAIYMADKMNDGINQVVVAARGAMDFLKKVSSVVAKQETPITWTTPVGFPAWQEYKNSHTHRVDTFWGGVRLVLSLQQDEVSLNQDKMSNSISPNFVHSLDASMLMTTVNSCAPQGITSFAMIHDSYGTHACDTDALAQTLRESFVEMYSKDVLADFLAEVKQQIPEELHASLPPLPPKGSLNLADVKNSRYFFA